MGSLLLGGVCSKCDPTLVELCLFSSESRCIKYTANEIEAEFVTSYNVFSVGFITMIIQVSDSNQ